LPGNTALFEEIILASEQGNPSLIRASSILLYKIPISFKELKYPANKKGRTRLDHKEMFTPSLFEMAPQLPRRE
jgi:hypothetical protein